MTTIIVHPIRLAAQYHHARLMAAHGMGLARNAGTVRSIAAEYALSGVRTWAQLADALEPIRADIDAQVRAARGDDIDPHDAYRRTDDDDASSRRWTG